IANAIDLVDYFLPRLQSLNCKPMVVTFRAYSKDQIHKMLHERLMELPYTVFQPQALELCARKVAAASGDMRKALCVCRSPLGKNLVLMRNLLGLNIMLKRDHSKGFLKDHAGRFATGDEIFLVWFPASSLSLPVNLCIVYAELL
ncbi:cell division control protein 6 homolog B-like, partial [Fagus crenata]